jgi:antitoxin (DNA-binding transcriptional repressor) of toxin-antitoxin stability system
VYVTFDEFKEGRTRQEAGVRASRGLRPARRRGPHGDPDRGIPAPTPAQARSRLRRQGRAERAHVRGSAQGDKALWLVAGLRHVLQYAKAGHAPTAWFYPVAPLPARTRALSGYLAVLGRVFGFALPRPAFLDLREPGRMARWLADRARAGRPVCLTTYGSSVARICAAARDDGLDLAGVAFVAIGEPYTEARRNVVTSAGARPSTVWSTRRARSCAVSRLLASLACPAFHLVQRRRPVGDGGNRRSWSPQTLRGVLSTRRVAITAP